MENLYLILSTEIVFSALVAAGLIYFVKKTRKSQKQIEKDVAILEKLVDVQDKVLNEYRESIKQ